MMHSAWCAACLSGSKRSVLFALLAVGLPLAVKAQTIPNAPTNLVATVIPASQINLTWNDTSNDEDGFKIERSTDGTNFIQIAQVLPNTISYRDTGLWPGTTYYYQVRAYNSGGNSDFSNVVSASTPAPPCPLSVVGWGDNSYGQLTPPAGLSNLVTIAAGYAHSLALKSDGTVVGWGTNYFGGATPPAGLSNVMAIAAGYVHSLALKSDGTVVGWGTNYFGEAMPPAGLSNVMAIAAGYAHSLALKSDGTVVGWGTNSYGQATPPVGLTGVVAIAAGYVHSLALKSGGPVVGWGRNNFGQATPPVGLTGVVAIAAGYAHSLALKSDGTVVGWGANWYGQATPPVGLTRVVAIAAGALHSLALKSDGAVVGWGYDRDDEATPPVGMIGVTAIAAGYAHSLALAACPGAPSGLTATAVSASEIDLSWSENSSGVEGFEIDRAPDAGGSPGTWAQIATNAAFVTFYSDTAVATNTMYWYRVRAYNACTDSPYTTLSLPVVLLDDTWSSGIHTNQNLPTSSAWWTSSATDGPLSASVGTMSMIVTTSSAAMIITYFTPDSNSPPVWLNVGDRLTATFKFIFDGVPTVGSSSQGFRIGLFDFADGSNVPKRVSSDESFSSSSQGTKVPGYALFEKMYATFKDQQPIDIRKRTSLSSGTLLGSSSDWTSLAKDSLNTNAFGGFADLTPYSLQMILRRTGVNSMAITVTWSNMVNGATLSDSATDYAATNFSFDGVAFRPQNNSQVPATNQFQEVIIELTSAPVAAWIIMQPQDQTVFDGENATFTVVTSGTLPLCYQWYYSSNAPVANATNSTLTLTNVQFADAGGYSVLVSNSYGLVTSTVAQLTVTSAPPGIITQPQDQLVLPGQTATFSVVANGSAPLSYQWYYNISTLLTGATATTLTLTNVQFTYAGSYSVVVSNSLGSVISSNAILTVTTIPTAPSGLTAVAVSGTEIDLSWTDNSSNEDGFKIERAPDSSGAPGAWTQIATNSANVTTYFDATLSPQTKYWYRVRAYNAGGNSDYSNGATATTLGPLRAFPGAEGLGAYAVGGRSGTVYHVTNLNDSGSGSFRDAVSAPNRTVVFDVSGTINLLSNLIINNSNLTVAGQTAPGDGITLKGWLTSVEDTHDVIVRYIRCRAGDVNCPNYQDDAFHVDNGVNVIVDHVSASWSIDETLSVTHSTNVTVQWSTITESLYQSCHDKGPHGYGSLLRYGAGELSFHHNLYAENWSRNPRLGDSIHLDFVNNVLYNWENQAGYNENDSADNPNGYTNYLNYVGNYLIAGSNTTSPKRTTAFHSNVPDPAFSQIYQSGNLMDTNVDGVLDGVDLGWNAFAGTFTTNTSRFTSPRVSTDDATTAYVRVLSSVGASAARDAVDARIVSDVITETGGIINSQNDVGGWPTLNSLPAPIDTDQDGMPDFWEAALGLNPNDPSDRNALTPDGDTRLEQYLNWLAGPHARVQTNSVVYVELRQYTAGVQNPTYAVSSATNGTVVLLGDGHTAQFTPTPGFSGLAGFLFTADGAPSSLTGTVSALVTPLVVTANLVWHGDGVTNNWDVATTANWLIGTSAAEFSSGDNVTFNDTGSNNPAINLVGTLLPSSVTVAASKDYTFWGTGSLGGLMSLVKSGSGQLTVMTSNTFSGGMTVSNGTLLVNNTTGSGTGTGAVIVVGGATLGGSGIIGGPVTVNGTLAPGSSAGTLTVSNNLAVSGGAVLQYDLGTSSDLTTVNGDLTLGGTLNITDAGGFTYGTYTLFSYGGTLTDNGMTIGTVPDTNLIYTVDISSNGFVMLHAVPLPPVAGFSGSPTSGTAPLPVTFTDRSSGTITNRYWNFGDGNMTNTTVTSLSHTYAAGTYTVSLTASGPAGSDTSTLSNYIVVLTPGSITVTPTSYNFSTITTGMTEQATLVVTNSGGTAVSSGTATSSAPFSIVSGSTFTVPGYGTTNVVVQFAPVTQGVSSNSVGFATANGGSATISVTGTSTNAPWDTNAPTLTILSPTDNEVFTNTAITVDGTASDANGIAGVTVNGSAASGTTNWTDAFTLSLGTNTITVIATDNSYNHNMATQIVHAIYAPTNHPPVIISPPVVTNALLQVDGMAVVIGGETNTFAVGAIDPDSDTLSYRWLFGDGVTNGWSPSNTAQHAYTTNCGPYTAGVSVSDGDLAVSSNLTVVIACDLAIKKMQLKLNFAKANTDSASLSVTNLDLGAGFGVTNKVVRVGIGGTTNVVFTLDAKGKGVSGLGSCKLTYNKKTGTWGLTAKLAKGSWHTAWASYGLVNADVPKTPPTTVIMPVVVMIGTDAFAAEHTMFYTAKASKSGLGK